MIETTTVVAIVSPILLVLCGAVAALWKMQIKQGEATERKLHECEKGHVVALKQHAETSGRLGDLEGFIKGYNEAREETKGLGESIRDDLRELSNDLLARIDRRFDDI